MNRVTAPALQPLADVRRAPGALPGGRMGRWHRRDLSAAEARRVALAAQGWNHTAAEPPRVDRRHLNAVFARLGLVQMDSVNVLARAHYLPFYSRLGPYPTDALDRLAYGRTGRALFEYWGHEASLIHLSLHPFLRWRMERAAAGVGIYGNVARLARENRGLVDEVFSLVQEHGPAGAGTIEKRLCQNARKGVKGWWGWSDVKRALEYLFWSGRVTTARRHHFERLYDLPERVIPAAVHNLPAATVEEAHRHLLRVAARALGVATEADLRDYFRLDPKDVAPRLRELVDAGELRVAGVEGWSKPAYLDPEGTCPRRLKTTTLVSPFDPLLWERPRAERLFAFRYRLEIYTPADRREHGYYVLPFLLEDRFVARLDLKANRAQGCLEVRAAHLEPGALGAEVTDPLRLELSRLQRWLGLEKLRVADRGDLAPALRR
ncbi:MAG TPA: crosslink repair DNA glycosylase YcaQ family protein [Chthoniobacterales bacterium]